MKKEERGPLHENFRRKTAGVEGGARSRLKRTDVIKTLARERDVISGSLQRADGGEGNPDNDKFEVT